MKLLLTGSSGFIGNYFVKKYADFYEFHKFSFRNEDLSTLDLKNTNTVLHLSALVHQMGGASVEEYERVNVTQTLELAKKAKEGGVEHFIFMSSVKVYGEESDSVYSEQTLSNPQDEYGVSKLNAERRLQELESENFKVSILRTPIVYGEGVKANIKNLISLVSKIPILPFGEISNKRSMVYIGNLCHLIDEIIRQQKSGIFLAADDRPLSTTELIELIAKELNKKVYLIKIPLFASLLQAVKPFLYKRLYKSLEVDNTQTKERLSLCNPYSVEEGIAVMIHGEKI